MFSKQQPVLGRRPPEAPAGPGLSSTSVLGNSGGHAASGVDTSPLRPSVTPPVNPVSQLSEPRSDIRRPDPAAATPAVEQPQGSRLIVGPDVKLRGAEILDCDTLVVEGRVEATMDSRVIQIAEQGAFSGKVGIDIAEIHGEFDGELTARQQLIIHATGRVRGKIRYGKLLIEAGGIISGDIESLAELRHDDARANPNSSTRQQELPIPRDAQRAATEKEVSANVKPLLSTVAG